MKTALDPSSWVVRFGDLIPEKTPVLDVACGNGRHTRLFLERGHSVTAIDIDLSRVQDLTDSENVELVQANLEDGSPWPFTSRTFGAVIITNYLYPGRVVGTKTRQHIICIELVNQFLHSSLHSKAPRFPQNSHAFPCRKQTGPHLPWFPRRQ